MKSIHNVKFIAACNPYRLDTGKRAEFGLHYGDKYKNKKLVYVTDIKKYIENIVLKTLEESINDMNIIDYIKPLTHEFSINSFNISTASLREIRRWDILFSYSFEEMKKVFGGKYDFEEIPTKIQNLIADEVNLESGENPDAVNLLSYQGSLTSNSEGILRVFENAEKSILDNSLNNIISAIYFDELGLAELSSNNHFKEYDDNKNKISFIGISNYCLDASKMNRGIHLSIPEPDIEDMKTTVLAITESYNIKFEDLKLKDFYYLIKIVPKLLIKHKFPQNKLIIIELLCEIIERNFGGLNNSGIGEKKQYDVIKCITENVNDFNNDTIHSHYTVKELNKIQVTMNTEDKNSNTQNYFTNDKFRCIVLIDKNDIYKEDPSSLNRFEKHYITFEYLLDKSYNDLSKEINKILTRYNKNPEGLNINQYKSQLMKRIVRTFSQDIMFFIRNFDFAEKYIIGTFNRNSIKNVYIDQYSSESEIDEVISEYLISQSQNLIIFHYNLEDYKKQCQMFIDNLNSLNNNFKEIYESSTLDLFKNKSLINGEEEFKKDLYHKIIGTNIIMKIFNEYNFDESEVDFISIIIKHMKSIYNDALITFNDIYRYYIDNFNTSIIRYINMSSREKIDTYLGISFPGVILSFKEIDRCIIENRVNYLDNENENIYENNIVIKFKEQFVNKYINFKDSFDIENHINVIFDDYIIYYLSKSNYNYTNKKIITNFSLFIGRCFSNRDDYQSAFSSIEFLERQWKKFYINMDVAIAVAFYEPKISYRCTRKELLTGILIEILEAAEHELKGLRFIAYHTGDKIRRYKVNWSYNFPNGLKTSQEIVNYFQIIQKETHLYAKWNAIRKDFGFEVPILLPGTKKKGGEKSIKPNSLVGQYLIREPPILKNANSNDNNKKKK
ncbi:hypothetical protein U3516DRAFT_761583 [Neocallimastix sp. 'constans']